MDSIRKKRTALRRADVRKVTIDAEQVGQRIDNFLRRELPGVPRSRLYRILRKGEVRVNGGRVRPDYRLGEGDQVRIPPAKINTGPGKVPRRQVELILDRIVFEDNFLIVINKPSGLAVHGGSGISHGAIELLRAARPELRDLSLVHRIDRDTSGCLVIAKKRSALRKLQEKFRLGVVEKNYLALVVGDWQFGERLVDAPLLVDHRKKGERHVVISGAGKSAKTLMSLSRSFGHYSLLQCRPLTGRTHQIRVHAKYTGHPIVGDERYGGISDNAVASKIGLKRLFLHAQSISFPEDSGNDLHFVVPLSDDLQQFLDRISSGLKTKKTEKGKISSAD